MFRRKKNPVELPEHVKLIISQAEDLLKETRDRSRDKGFSLTLTYKMQLDDDCRALNRAMEQVQKGHFEEKDLDKLEKAIRCLQTTSENILEWKWGDMATKDTKVGTRGATQKEKDSFIRNEMVEDTFKKSSLHHMGSVNMITERLRIRRFEPEDAQAAYENFGSDPLVHAYVNFAPCSTVEAAEEFISMHVENYVQDDSFYGWAIEYDGKLIGSIGAFDVDEEMRSVEIGYRISSRYWNKGFTTEATQAVLHHLFDKVGFHRVYASCHEKNMGSAKVMEKCGMTLEGRMRHATKGADGKYADLLCYSILEGELLL